MALSSEYKAWWPWLLASRHVNTAHRVRRGRYYRFAVTLQRAARSTRQRYEYCYRGEAWDVGAARDRFTPIGKVLRFDRLTSASPSLETAEIYARRRSIGSGPPPEYPFVLAFMDPAGIVGVAAPTFMHPEITHLEIVLPRGARYRVDRIDLESWPFAVELSAVASKRSVDRVARGGNERCSRRSR